MYDVLGSSLPVCEDNAFINAYILYLVIELRWGVQHDLYRE
jgi:hypothetical protein